MQSADRPRAFGQISRGYRANEPQSIFAESAMILDHKGRDVAVWIVADFASGRDAGRSAVAECGTTPQRLHGQRAGHRQVHVEGRGHTRDPDHEIHSRLRTRWGGPGHQNLTIRLLPYLELAAQVLAPIAEHSTCGIMAPYKPPSECTAPRMEAEDDEVRSADRSVLAAVLTLTAALRQRCMKARPKCDGKLRIRQVLIRERRGVAPSAASRPASAAQSCRSTVIRSQFIRDGACGRSMGGSCQRVLRSGDAAVSNVDG